MRRTKSTLWSGSNSTGKKTLNKSINNFNCLIAEAQSSRGSMFTYLFPIQSSSNYMTMGYYWESNTKLYRQPSRLQFTDLSTCYNLNGTLNELGTGNNTDTMWYEPRSGDHTYITEINGYNDDEELLYDGTSTSSVASSEISLAKAADNYTILKFVLGDSNNGSLVSYYLKVDKNNSTMKFMLNGCYSDSSAFTIYNSLWHFNGFDKITSDNKALYYSKNWGTSYYVNYNVSYTYTTSTSDFRVRPIRKIYGIK